MSSGSHILVASQIADSQFAESQKLYEEILSFFTKVDNLGFGNLVASQIADSQFAESQIAESN